MCSPAGSTGEPQLLADLHAGVFDEQAAALRLRVAADSRARTVLAALDATVADLAALPRQRGAVRMPDEVANRLDSALAAESREAPCAPPPDLTAPPGLTSPPDLTAPPGLTAPPDLTSLAEWTATPDLTALRHRSRTGWAGVALLAAAAAAATVVALSGVRLDIAGPPQGDDALGTASGIQSSEPLALTRSNLGGALGQALKANDYGPLSPPQTLQNCLAANGVPASGEPMGALEVTMDGHRGVLLVLPTDRTGQVRLLVVGSDCAPGNPSQMVEYTVDR